jgi:hypothetical protein
MKSIDLSNLLEALEPLIPDPDERSAVSKIASAFSRGGSTTVATLLRKVSLANPNKTSVGPIVASMSAGQLRRTLSHATRFLSAAGAKTASADLQSLIDSLQSISNAALADWLIAFDGALAGPPKKSKRSKGPVLRPAEQIEMYARRFDDAGFDEAAFLAAHAALNTDATVKAAEAKEIVHRVTQLTRKHASKKKALEFLLDDFYGRLRRHNELASVSKARPW